MANTSNHEALAQRDIFYFRQRYKNRVFQAVVAYFAKEAQQQGLTKRDIALRLGKDPAQVTRWLSGPGNWTLDTVSDLLLAMNAEMSSEIEPFDDVASHNRSTGVVHSGPTLFIGTLNTGTTPVRKIG